jgi:hypothetical protein
MAKRDGEGKSSADAALQAVSEDLAAQAHRAISQQFRDALGANAGVDARSLAEAIAMRLAELFDDTLETRDPRKKPSPRGAWRKFVSAVREHTVGLDKTRRKSCRSPSPACTKTATLLLLMHAPGKTPNWVGTRVSILHDEQCFLEISPHDKVRPSPFHFLLSYFRSPHNVVLQHTTTGVQPVFLNSTCGEDSLWEAERPASRERPTDGERDRETHRERMGITILCVPMDGMGLSPTGPASKFLPKFLPRSGPRALLHSRCTHLLLHFSRSPNGMPPTCWPPFPRHPRRSPTRAFRSTWTASPSSLPARRSPRSRSVRFWSVLI